MKKMNPLKNEGIEYLYHILKYERIRIRMGYSLTKFLGFGSSATVYEAKDKNDNTLKVVKISKHKEFSQSEIKILNEVKDISSVIKFEKSLSDGKNLILSPVGVPIKDIKFTSEQFVKLVDTLEEVHKRGYVHNDISLSNILQKNQMMDLFLLMIGVQLKKVGENYSPFIN